MRIFLLFLILTISLFGYSQNHYLNGKHIELDFKQSSTHSSDRTYFCNNTPCEGLIETRDSCNQLLSRAQFSNGKQNGIFQYYYPNGNLEIIGQMIDNCHEGLIIKFYPNGKLKSTEYYPPKTCGIIEGTEMISFYENSQIETWYVYKGNWKPQFHYYFSIEGDTLGFMRPSEQDTTIFEEINFELGERINHKLFRLSDSGERVYIQE